jgi:methylenetetrahydrofolate--tRNA-(uracil-5-)-methyltransferase
MAGRFIAAERLGGIPSLPPDTTSIGALLCHITGGADEKNFQPMNVNFGLFPPIVGPEALNQKGKQLKGKDRKQAMSNRARRDFNSWLDTQSLTL